MTKRKSKLECAQKRAERVAKIVNKKINELDLYVGHLNDALNAIQKVFDDIRNVPSDKQLDYKNMEKIHSNWKHQVEEINSNYQNTIVKNIGNGIAGVSAGVAVASLGPTAAMGVATTFGVASTGTAISTLSGAAATNAALAWLGGGALVAGGGGVAVGNLILTLTGPVGWTIAVGTFVFSGCQLWHCGEDKKRIDDIYIRVIERDVKSYKLAIIEIDERISRIKNETQQLNSAIEKTKTFGLDYHSMTEAMQYELGSYVNLMNSAIQLLVNPIMGVQPKYNENDLEDYIAYKEMKIDDNQKTVIIDLSNRLYNIHLDKTNQKLLWKTLKKDKNYLSSVGMTKKEFKFQNFEIVTDALEHKYHNENMTT